MANNATIVGFDQAAMDALMPMHLLLRDSGFIERVGPTLTKLHPNMDFVGKHLFEVLDLRRPHPGSLENQELKLLIGAKLRLVFRSEPQAGLKGIFVDLQGTDLFLLNLSFGVSVVEAVRQYALTISDFAPTDLTAEMLFMFEAKSVVLKESRDLNVRLHQARMAAEDQASTDVLTGLKNRRAMDNVLTHALLSDRAFGLMHLDLDFFKQVNDTFGHAADDKVLQTTANVLLQETRFGDTIARVGGDEFVLIFL